MTRADTGISLPGTPEASAPKTTAAVTELLAQAGDIAARTERANRPMSLIYISGAFLAVGLCVLLYFFSARASAVSKLTTEATRANNIERLVAKLKDFDRINEERREDLKPFATLQTMITEAGVAAGLKTKLPPAQPGSGRGPGDLTRRTWRYTDLHEESLEKVFDWISRSLRSVPGLELTGFTLRPDAQTWRIDVTFGRWERAGS